MAKRIPIYSHCEYLPTTSGLLKICANEQGISAITFVMQEDAPVNGNAVTKEAKQQLSEYFNQQRQAFDLPLAPMGTQFQQNVWQQLCAIPYGETCSYADIAKQLNNPNAVRAVGSANGKNPISIVVPCHRVIGANGTLTGYAGGLTRKAALLTLENPKFTVPTGKLTT